MATHIWTDVSCHMVCIFLATANARRHQCTKRMQFFDNSWHVAHINSTSWLARACTGTCQLSACARLRACVRARVRVLERARVRARVRACPNKSKYRYPDWCWIQPVSRKSIIKIFPVNRVSFWMPSAYGGIPAGWVSTVFGKTSLMVCGHAYVCT